VALCRISFSLELLKPSLLCLLRTLLHFLIPFLPANFYLPHPSTRNPFTTPTRQSDSQPETLAMRLSVHSLTIITVILFLKFAYSSHSVASDELKTSILSVIVILYTESNDILYGWDDLTQCLRLTGALSTRGEDFRKSRSRAIYIAMQDLLDNGVSPHFLII